jgi:hypothetical protein
MSKSHRRDTPVSRRGLLGLAALAALPVAGFGYSQMRSDGTPSGTSATKSPGKGAVSEPSAAPTPEPFAQAKPGEQLGGTVPFVPGKALFGSYLGLDGMEYSEALALRKKQLGREQRIVHVFYAWRDNLPSSIPYLPKGAIPMVSWRGPKHETILSGESDSYIAASARQLRDLDRPTLLRWGWEMNGDWYAWGGFKNNKNAQGYVDCYQHLWKIFQKQGADNVSWVWSPNWNNAPNEAWNRMEAYYPGDEYVDWVGVSGYNLHKEDPATLFDPIYQKYSPIKPLMITEIGSVDRGGTTKADWITAFTKYIEQRPAFGGVTWFDTDTHPSWPERWRIDTDPASTAAYRAMARNPRFGG